MGNFVHLHVHTEYSLLDGAARIATVTKRAKELGMDALAITDHGNMYGAVAFFDACEKVGIKAIIGTEFYVCDDLSVKQGKTKLNHLVLLCKNETGYNNIAKLNSIAFRDGFYYKPRIDLKTLAENHEGLVCLSACLAGDIPQAIMRREFDEAERLVRWFKDVFGEDFYLELQNHDIPEQKEVNQYLRLYAKKYGIKTVATNDVHYVTREDAVSQDVLMCVQMGADYDDPQRLKFANDEFYLKSREEMVKALPADIDAIDNTLEVAAKCNFGFVYGHYMFPHYEPVTGDDPETYIRKLIDAGIKKKYGEETEEIRERIETELGVIKKQGFVEYFLIVWDYINAARNMGISVGPGRGSGAGSIVAYLIGITNIDPLKYDLYFERFLNPERVSAPDFDVDFEDSRRQEVIEYVRQKYGYDRVCKIVTFGTMAAKNAIKDVGRVLKLPYSETDRVTKAIPNRMTRLNARGDSFDLGRPNILMKVFGLYHPKETDKDYGVDYSVPELVEAYNADHSIKQMVDIACKLEDSPRQASTHACGVIIGADVLERHMPLGRNGDDITSQYTGVELEHLGFLKMDFLGLRNLSDIKMAIEYARKNHGVEIDFDKSDYADPGVYELISSGNTTAIFQIESAGFQKFLRELRPTCLEDIVAAVSLYRPGPMDSIPKFVKCKHNPELITYLHPLLEPILKSTYGCIVYQEQVMKIVQSLAGYTLGQADMVRRMMGKKKVDEMIKEEAVFINGKPESVDKHGKVSTAIDGCLKRGVSEEVARKIWDEMKDFAKYAFNKSHAAAYSLVTYQTAYLKRYYEPEFLTAVLNNRITNIEEIRNYVTYAREEGVPVLPPDINESEGLFTVDEKGIRYGLGAIKGIGLGAIDVVVEERKRGGAFTSFENYVRRVDIKALNKRLVESLIFAGAFDSLGVNRSQLIASYEQIIDMSAHDKQRAATGQLSFFDNMESVLNKFEYPNIKEYPLSQKLAYEKEVAGVYLTGHPLNQYKEHLKGYEYNTASVNETIEGGEEEETQYSVAEDTTVRLGGMLVSAEKRLSKKSGREFGVGKLEDLYGTVELMLSGYKYSQYKNLFVKDGLVTVVGKLRHRDEGASISVDRIESWDGVRAGGGKKICFYLSFRAADESVIDKLQNILKAYEGSDETYIKNTDDGKLYPLGIPTKVNDVMLNELCGLVGERNIKVIGD